MNTLKNLSVTPVKLAVALIFMFGLATPAFAAHPEVSLPGSDFEIDTDANLKVDHPQPPLPADPTDFDWANVSEDRQGDTPSGNNDDAFGQGSKEDTPVPSVVSGSIPPNKSDLFTFGVYLEDNGPTDLFLHVFWHRVQDPSGTTLMDFEFNQSDTISANGVTPARTAGDLLVQYELGQGGTVPELFLSRWLTAANGDSATDCEASNKLPCWSTREDLTDSGDATGSINTSMIPAADSDGLGDLDPRTFGEATIDFDMVGTSGGQASCANFGSAYLKSRSSDSFTAALKDFITPKQVDVTNCAGLKIIKEDDFGVAIQGVKFDLFPDNAPTYTDGGVPGSTYNPSSGGGEDGIVSLYTCTTNAAGECTITNIFAGDFWIVEDPSSVPLGYSTTSAPQGVQVEGGSTIQEFTFTNDVIRGTIKVRKNTDPDASTQQFTFNPSWKDPFMLADDGGENVSGDLLPSAYDDGGGAVGNYSVSESPQSGWSLASAACVSSIDGGTTNPSAITLRPNETVTCTFNNEISLGTIIVWKETDPGGSSQEFTFNPDWKSSFTLKDGENDPSSDLLPSSEAPGGVYTVSETVPEDWNLTSATCVDSIDNTNTDPASIDLRPGETVTCTFNNAAKRGAILITKTRKHAADGSGDHPHEGVTFTTSGGSLTSDDISQTDNNGEICVGNLLFDDYSVTESVPSGYTADGLTTKPVSVTVESTCGDGNEATVSFGNTPLTNITVTVDSQVDGGTASTIDCVVDSTSTDANGDGSLILTDLQPATYICTIVVDP